MPAYPKVLFSDSWRRIATYYEVSSSFRSLTRCRKIPRAGVYYMATLLCVIAAGAAEAAKNDIAVLRGLDKVTARIFTIRAPVGEIVHFGTLEIIARSCDKRPPEEPPESAAFLDVWEARRGESAVSLFRGWMFASSPALSALEHPVYDVWVIDCQQPSNAAGDSGSD
jgi:hypothetical protein